MADLSNCTCYLIHLKKFSEYLHVYLMCVLSVHYVHRISLPHPYKTQSTVRQKYFLLFKRSRCFNLVIPFNLPVEEEQE